MKRSSAVFLQTATLLIGIGVFAFMLWEPHLEGRNTNATLFQIYFNDPFLAFAYIGSISFFVGLYQIFKVLGYAGQRKIFSQPAVNALRTIIYCAMTLIGFVILGEICILLNTSDDRAGGVSLGILIIAGSIVVATIASKFERNVQRTVDIQSKNNVTA